MFRFVHPVAPVAPGNFCNFCTRIWSSPDRGAPISGDRPGCLRVAGDAATIVREKMKYGRDVKTKREKRKGGGWSPGQRPHGCKGPPRLERGA